MTQITMYIFSLVWTLLVAFVKNNLQFIKCTICMILHKFSTHFEILLWKVNHNRLKMFALFYFPFVVITFLNIQICISRIGPNTYIEYGNIFFIMEMLREMVLKLHYNKMCPYMPSDFIGFWMNSLVVVGTNEEAMNSLV
jgi:hypothetical protein